jgi:hypothetical protein
MKGHTKGCWLAKGESSIHGSQGNEVVVLVEVDCTESNKVEVDCTESNEVEVG